MATKPHGQGPPVPRLNLSNSQQKATAIPRPGLLKFRSMNGIGPNSTESLNENMNGIHHQKSSPGKVKHGVTWKLDDCKAPDDSTKLNNEPKEQSKSPGPTITENSCM